MVRGTVIAGGTIIVEEMVTVEDGYVNVGEGTAVVYDVLEEAVSVKGKLETFVIVIAG